MEDIFQITIILFFSMLGYVGFKEIKNSGSCWSDVDRNNSCPISTGFN